MLVTVLVYVLRRRPGWLVVTLTGLVLASWAWTSHLAGSETEVNLLLRTSVRIDAPLAGALAAAALPFLPGCGPTARRSPPPAGSPCCR